MKRRILLFLLLLPLIAPWAANAQTVTIGTGTSTQNNSPIANYYNYSFTEMIYTAEEIPVTDPNADYILSLGFQLASAGLNGKTYSISIYMQNVSAEQFAEAAFTSVSADDLVYEGTVSATTSGWVTLDLDTPFHYDLTKNLLIAVNKTGGSYAGSSCYWNYTASGKNQHLYKQNDSGAYSIGSLPTTPTLNGNRPNVQLTLGALPTCPKPTLNPAENITEYGASFRWTQGEANSWILEYSTNPDFTNSVVVNRNGIPAIRIEDFSPSTNYYVRVRANCGDGDLSDWSNVITFSTTSVPVDVGDGWSDDFEGSTLNWDLANGTQTNQWTWGTAVNNGGTHALYISNDNGITNAYTIGSSLTITYATKLFSFNEGKYVFAYDWKAQGESNYDYIRVWLAPSSATFTPGQLPNGTTTMSGYTTATPEGWIDLGGKLNLVTEWQTKNLIKQVAAGNYYLVFMWGNDGGGGTQPPAAIDNVSIVPMPCPYDVTDLAVSDITATGATLTWTAGDAEEWQVATKTSTGDWTILPNTYTTSSAMLDDLTPDAVYQVRVRAYCSADDQGLWCDPIDFRTACGAITIGETAWMEDFEDFYHVTAAPGWNDPKAYMMNDGCWAIDHGEIVNPALYTSYKPAAFSGNTSVQFTNAKGSATLILPEFSNALNTLQFEFKGCVYMPAFEGTLEVGYWYEGQFTPIHTGIQTQTPRGANDNTNASGGYMGPYLLTGDIPSGSRIALHYSVNAESGCINLDDFRVSLIPDCLKPTNLAASNVTENTVTLNWTENGTASAWQICLNGDEEHLVDVNSNSFTVEGLSNATVYTAKVRAYCSEDDQSDWSNEVSFTTECGVITTFPWSEDFEDYGSGDFSDVCWVNEHISGSGSKVFKVYTGSNGGNTTHQLQLPDQAIGTLTKLVLPKMTLPENYEFSIDIYRSSSTYNEHYPEEGIRVYASTNGEIEGATELAFIPRHFGVSNDVIPAEEVSDWYTYELPIGISGTCYIILRGESQYCTSTYMDNFVVKPMPNCIKPTGLVATNPDAHGATLNWTVNDDTQIAWDVQVSDTTDFSHGVILYENVDRHEDYLLTGLDPETQYYVRVRGNCGAEDGVSEWSNIVTFTTIEACLTPTGLVANPGNVSATLNWVATSESYTVSYRTAAYADGIVEHFDSSSIPEGWMRYTGLVDEVIAGTTTLSSTTSGWSTTSYAFGDYNMKANIWGSGCKYWLVTPEFKPSQDLDFDLALTDFANSDPIEDPTAQADDRFVVLIYANDAWTILREWNNSGSEYVYNTIATEGEHVTIDLSAYYGQKVKIAFYGESTASGGDNDLHIDNVICGTPYEAGEWQTITVADTTALITGLAPETDYEAKVQGDCGDEGLSHESAIISFTTLEACPVPQNVEVDDVTGNSATVNWDGYNESYTVSYRSVAYTDGVIEHFDASGIPSGWMRYSGLVDEVIAGTTTLTSTTSGWNSNSYAFGDYNVKVNIFGANCKYWLVTPEFKPSQDLDFDLALTDYNNSNPIENDTLQADDRFVVLIYANDAWTILREWNNSGSAYVYNTIATTGEHATIDLSAYYGQKVKIAFYGESTVTSNGDNDLHIDNIVCGVPVEAGEWQTVDATESPVTLTGLAPETPYEVKVKGYCDDFETEWSESVTFTTTELTTLTQTIALSAGVNWFSTNLEITMDDLKAALVAAAPAGNTIVITSQRNGMTTYNGSRWRGTLTTLDVAQSYRITVGADCEITLEGMPVDPAEHPITINSGANWIGFPLQENMTIATAFVGFAINGDAITSQREGMATYNGARWRGTLGNGSLKPGQGYIYKSAASESRVFIFPYGGK